jgi:type II secretory pathway pseudopilin PulG
MFKLPNNQSGFSIIEAIVAIVVLMIAFVSIVSIFPFSINITGNAQQQSIASAIALSKIEEIRTINYEEMATGIVIPRQAVSLDSDNIWSKFDYQVEVQFLNQNLEASLTDSGLKQVKVTVFWQSPVKKTEQSTEISTIIANY